MGEEKALSGFSLDPLSAGLIVAAVIHLAAMSATLMGRWAPPVSMWR